jgi:ABC-type transport system involved in multi-copper enzyme maturation permease subunit
VTDALRFEWVRIRTLRSTYWLIGLALVLSAAVALIFGLATRSDPLTVVIIGRALTAGGDFGVPFPAIFMAIIGIFATGHEYRHNTIQPTLTAIPQRSRLLAAKVIVVVATAVLVAVVSMLLCWVVFMITRGESVALGDAPLPEALGGYVVYTVLWAVLGLALAQLFRGVPSAIVVIFVFPFIVETVIVGLSFVPALDWLQPALKFLPFSAGSRLFAFEDFPTGEGQPNFDFLDRWVSGSVFAVFVGVILAIGWVLFQKKDA